MEETGVVPGGTIDIVRGCLVVAISSNLYEQSAFMIQRDVLKKIEETGVKGVVINMAGVDMLDSTLANIIFDTARTTPMLGATTVIVGFKPGVVASIIDLDVKFGDIRTALTLEDGLNTLEPIVSSQGPFEENEDEEETPQEEINAGDDYDDEM